MNAFQYLNLIYDCVVYIMKKRKEKRKEKRKKCQQQIKNNKQSFSINISNCHLSSYHFIFFFKIVQQFIQYNRI